MIDKIRCPYCRSERLQIIGGSLENGYMSFKSWTEYKCLDNESHIFKTVKYSKINE